MNFSTIFSRIMSATCLAAALGFPATGAAAAEDEPGLPFQVGPTVLRATLDAGAGAFSVKNAQFGVGSNSRTGERAGGRNWYEAFVTPGLQFQVPTNTLGDIYGRLSASASATRGAGDAQAASTTSDQPDHFGIEDAYLGWRSGTSFDLPDNAIDLSIGNQPFVVGDGFLIANGAADGGGRAAYFLGPRGAFERTAIARINMDPVRADLFHLQGNVDQVLMAGNDAPDTRLVGANIEWFGATEDAGRFDYDKRDWYVGVTALKVYEADGLFSFSGARGGGDVAANRDGLNVFSARFGGRFIPALDALGLYGEWAVQRNAKGGNGGSVQADAWHLQPEYTFADLPWTPVLTARYAHFSGDPDTGDDVDESWDPLYSDAGPRGITTWTQGFIYSQYIGSNSNLSSYHVGLRVLPADALELGIAYYRHDFAKPSQAGATSAHLMDEIDLYATWTTPIPGLTVSPALAAGMAGKGQRQALGIVPDDERTIWLGQVVLAYQF
jgi:hypothetical protein